MSTLGIELVFVNKMITENFTCTQKYEKDIKGRSLFETKGNLEGEVIRMTKRIRSHTHTNHRLFCLR